MILTPINILSIFIKFLQIDIFLKIKNYIFNIYLAKNISIRKNLLFIDKN